VFLLIIRKHEIWAHEEHIYLQKWK